MYLSFQLFEATSNATTPSDVTPVYRGDKLSIRPGPWRPSEFRSSILKRGDR